MKYKKKEKTKGNKKVFKILFVLVIIILIISSILILKKSKASKNIFIGNWTIDGITSYEFYNDGKGKLKIPTDEFEFIYTLKDNKIYIDFKSDNAKDSYYEYSIKKNKIILKGIEETSGIYELTKQN